VHYTAKTNALLKSAGIFLYYIQFSKI